MLRIVAKKKVYILSAAVFLFAFVLRLYKLTAPLWLDEIYGFALAQRGVDAILENSYHDPHPPLYYLWVWIVSGFGAFHNGLSLRWLSVILGALTVLMIWHSARRITGDLPAFLVSLVAATSPALVYYSQEARPFVVSIFISSLSMYLVIKISLENAHRQRLLGYWTILTLVGMYCGYSYLMVAGLQLVYLGFTFRWRRGWWISGLIILIGGFILLPFAYSSLRSTAIVHLDSKPLSFWRSLQTMLAGEAGRYGVSIAHQVMPVIFLVLWPLSALGRMKNRLYLYLFTQVTYPFAFVFLLLTPVFKINLPFAEAKQFLVLLPFLLILASAGIEAIAKFWSQRVFQYAFFLLITLGLLWMNALGLWNYWRIPKSSEGFLVQSFMQRQIPPGKGIVSLYYSVDYALGYYWDLSNVYINPQMNGGEYEFTIISNGTPFFQQMPKSKERISASDLRKSGNFWILFRTAYFQDALSALTKDCVTGERFKINRFEALHVKSCPVAELGK